MAEKPTEASRGIEVRAVHLAWNVEDIGKSFFVTQTIGWPVKNDPRSGSALVERIVLDGGKFVIHARSLEPQYKGQVVRVVGLAAGVAVDVDPMPKEMPADCVLTGRSRNMLVSKKFEEFAIEKWGDPEEEDRKLREELKRREASKAPVAGN